MSEAPEDNVVVFKQQPRDLRIRETPKPERYCLHRRVFISKDEPRLDCQDCGKLVEPYWLLRQWANERELSLIGVKQQRDDLLREIGELSETVRKLRGEFRDAAEAQAFLQETAVAIRPPRKARLKVTEL